MGQLLRAAIVKRGELADGLGNEPMKGRDAWLVARAAGDDHAPAGERTVVRGDVIALVSARHRRDGRLRANRRTRRRLAKGDEISHFAGAHESIRIRAPYRRPGRRLCQLGVRRRSESQRSRRHEFATSPRSSTR